MVALYGDMIKGTDAPATQLFPPDADSVMCKCASIWPQFLNTKKKNWIWPFAKPISSQFHKN